MKNKDMTNGSNVKIMIMAVIAGRLSNGGHKKYMYINSVEKMTCLENQSLYCDFAEHNLIITYSYLFLLLEISV
jgi:hypothetical protein